MSLKYTFRNIRHFFYRVNHFVKWLPVIWNDADYDYAYLLEIMQFKLKNMQEFFESDKPNLESAPTSANEIKEALKFVNRYFTENYRAVEYAEFDTKHGLSDNDSFWVWHNKFQALSELDKKEWLDIGKKADTEMHTDLVCFFDAIKTHIENWWD